MSELLYTCTVGSVKMSKDENGSNNVNYGQTSGPVIFILKLC